MENYMQGGVTVDNFPVIGTVIMVIIFMYAWISDTAERKEAFVDHTPRSVIESFYSAPLVTQGYKPYA
jgi:hypothetical protein